MVKPYSYYTGREQTYAKNLFLEFYLERVVYNIASFQNEFVFVDGFSGPWKSTDEKLGDTSFAIAIEKLSQIRKNLAQKGKNVKFRCLLNEKDPTAFRALNEFCKSVDDIEIVNKNSSFEDLIPEALKFIGNSFSLTFIDPTGLTGYPMKRLTPLLRLRGEVIINFMFDFANRFYEKPTTSDILQLDELFDSTTWLDAINQYQEHGLSREDALIQAYLDKLKEVGGYRCISSTPIFYPTANRTYFRLIYGTRHPKGLIEFRKAEMKAFPGQQLAYHAARLRKKNESTGIKDLFSAHPDAEVDSQHRKTHERVDAIQAAQRKILNLLTNTHSISYDDALEVCLEIPFVDEQTFKDLLLDMHSQNELVIHGLKKRPKSGNIIEIKL